MPELKKARMASVGVRSNSAAAFAGSPTRVARRLVGLQSLLNLCVVALGPQIGVAHFFLAAPSERFRDLEREPLPGIARLPGLEARPRGGRKARSPQSRRPS
jgi:hypothetical protein